MIDSAEQIRRYEELYKKKNFKVADILYQAWLMFKLDSIGSEQEAFNLVLKKRKPANLQPKKKREKVAPEGSARYNMNDPRWVPVFEDRMENEAKKNSRASKGKKGSSRSAAPPSTVTSGALESHSSVPGYPLPSISAPVDNSSNSKSRSGSKKPATASSTMASEAPDLDSELPDIPEPSLLVATTQSKRGKRKRGNSNNITSGKRAMLQRSNGEEVRSTVSSSSSEIVPSVPRFPLEHGLLPLINDDETDETSCDVTKDNAGTKAVVSKISTFLDIDFDLDTSIQDLNVSREEQPVSINEAVNSNSNSKSTRASGRLRSSGKSELSCSDKLTSMLTSTASAAPNNNMKGKGRSKGFSAASQSTVPTTIKDINGGKIMDQKTMKKNEISAKKKMSKRMPN